MEEHRTPNPGGVGSNPAGPGKMRQKVKIKDLLEKTKNFFVEIKSEGKKIIWPEKKELTRATIVVVIVVLVFAVYLGIFDFILTYLFSLV